LGAAVSAVADRLAALRPSIPAGVTLVAVSKGHPPERIREAFAAGQRHFGENYAQEWKAKADALSDLPGLVWHYVGGLQSNKAKVLVGRAAWIHTVDRLGLAQTISRLAAQRGATARVLLEVNVGGESQKAGCAPAEVPGLVEGVASLPGLELRGLMCIPPADTDPRPGFAALRALRDRLPRRLPDLSMGMSGDYPAAIAEGATLVRIGTAIFGPRPTRP
jgi:pyridoxal phosphate enzyme (YggS family)